MLREPPHSVDAEQSVLGGCLLDGNAVDRVPELRPACFYRATHRDIFQAILDAAECGDPIDPLTIAERLEGQGLLESVGGLTYLVELQRNTPSAANVGAYARIVADKARERELLAAVVEVGERAHGGGTAAEKIDFAQARFMALTRLDRSSSKRIGDLRGEFLATMEQRAAGATVGTPTMFQDLDRMLGGMRPGSLLIIAARPSTGKSSLALQIAQRNARNGRPVLCFSLEMSALDVHDRLVAWEAGIPLEGVTC